LPLRSISQCSQMIWVTTNRADAVPLGCFGKISTYHGAKLPRYKGLFRVRTD
jgi:hypothetical protein